MVILVVGLNHRTAPLKVREGVAFDEEQLGSALLRLTSHVKQGVILSTCNRTEIYALVGHPKSGAQNIMRFLSDCRGIASQELPPYLYQYAQQEAVHHLFQVAAGLDSMVLGEDQILGQVRDAFESAKKAKTVGPAFDNLFRRAIRVGKRARHETQISRNGVSVSSIAVEFAKKTLGPQGEHKVLVIGAGEMGELTAQAVVKDWGLRPTITSRTYERAVKLARKVKGEAVPFDAMVEALAEADVVISSTESPSYLFGPEEVAKALTMRQKPNLCFIDISVPRDIDPAVGRLENVTLYDIDSLRREAELGVRGKEEEVARVEAMVEEGVRDFMGWWDTLEVVPTVRALRDKIEAIRAGELEKALRQLNGLSDKEKQRIEALTSSIVNKILHQPVTRLKRPEDGRDYVRVLRELFDLQEEHTI
ncbi:MAG: glutamyl-tRNA reductase [Dehalococcoidia bacterium]